MPPSYLILSYKNIGIFQ